MRRASGAVHDEDAVGGEAATRHELLDTGLERFIRERREAVEYRRNETGEDPGDEQRVERPAQPRVEPPPAASAIHEEQRAEHDWAREHEGDRQPLHEIEGK